MPRLVFAALTLCWAAVSYSAASAGVESAISHGAVQTVTAAIDGSLETTIVRILPQRGAALAAQAARLLGWRGDVARDLRRGDLLRLVYQDAGDGEQPELLAARFDGQKISLRAYLFRAFDPEPPRFYDARGAPIAPRLKNSPVPSYEQITEVVQRGRGRRHHDGIDLKAPEGEPVLLPFAGRVQRVNWATRFNGRCIEVVYDKGLGVARFLHLSRIERGIKPGKALRAGARLGSVGSTGRSGASHLHYEIVTTDGAIRNPLRVHGVEFPRLTGSDAMARFARLRDQRDAQLLQQGAEDGGLVSAQQDVARPPLPSGP